MPTDFLGRHFFLLFDAMNAASNLIARDHLGSLGKDNLVCVEVRASAEVVAVLLPRPELVRCEDMIMLPAIYLLN